MSKSRNALINELKHIHSYNNIRIDQFNSGLIKSLDIHYNNLVVAESDRYDFQGCPHLYQTLYQKTSINCCVGQNISCTTCWKIALEE